MHMEDEEVRLQRSYYAATAQQYEARHVHARDEHYLALSWLAAMIELYEIRSVLDVGSGTGRALRYLKQRFPDLRVIGVEPSVELREVGYGLGLTPKDLLEGDANRLPFAAGAFDLVCEFGILHHIRTPSRAVAEMLRVADKAVFISDDNHLAAGFWGVRVTKLVLRALGLWGFAYWIKTRGKGYRVTADDGLAYPYSVFDDIDSIRAQCSSIHMLNTSGSGPNLLTSAGHVALMGLKTFNEAPRIIRGSVEPSVY